MFKSKLKFLFSTMVIAMCFAINLQSMQKAIGQKADDPFIREFVNSMNSSKITYDGESLTLYAKPATIDAFLTTAGTVAFTTGLVLCLASGENNIMISGSFWMIILDLICLYGLSNLMDYDNNKVPYLTIDDNQLKYWDNRKIKWDKVDRLKILETFESYDNITYSYSTIQLCDKFLTSLLEICDRRGNAPISVDNLFAILEHYVNKKQLGKKSEFNQLNQIYKI